MTRLFLILSRMLNMIISTGFVQFSTIDTTHSSVTNPGWYHRRRLWQHMNFGIKIGYGMQKQNNPNLRYSNTEIMLFKVDYQLKGITKR